MLINPDSSCGDTVQWVTTDTVDDIAQVLHADDAVADVAVLPTVRSQLLAAMHRLGLSFSLFGSAFMLLMIGLQFLVTPDRFPVRIGQKVVRLSQLLSERASIQTVQAQLLSKREVAEASVPIPITQKVRDLKKAALPIGRTVASVERVVEHIRQSSTSIHIESLAYDGKGLMLSGTIRDADARSIQVLASFVDALRLRSEIAAVSEPEYQQTASPDGGSTSSFVLHLTIRAS